jgi:phosphoserine phosphatase RsbU/P
VIGLLPAVTYAQSEIVLQPGDVVVAFTDGISEAMTGDDQEWGEERPMETVRSCAGLDARAVIERLFAGADAFTAGAPQYDMTAVVLRLS